MAVGSFFFDENSVFAPKIRVGQGAEGERRERK